CVADCAQNLSAGGTDYMKDGFLTDARAEEKQCPGMQAEILAEIVDVTAKVQAAGRGGDGAVFAAARDAAVASIEK
ncbi:S46 family peptidase, partial [Escherichia coli]|uniref:S46 family peptidase n=1 Tax=Escherichia coli TaxID=562 RepID=UPI003965723B